MSSLFPFTAIVGQDLLKQALVVNAVSPGIGGLLVRGEKGTAKSTLVRALATLLPQIPVVAGCPYTCDPDSPAAACPHCGGQGPHERALRSMPVVTLPAGATEDRVVGSIDIEQALSSGRRRFEPGLLAGAHRGILYIDEVNLIDDHIIDLLLDAAAMGVNTVEREGISFSHPARFLLVGTMNPEEGDVRPQLLDRFGLCVDVEALMDVEARAEIIRRRIAWERDPAAFAADCAAGEQDVRETIVAARTRLPQVTVEDAQLELAARLCVQLDVRSHRADIVTVRTALAIAACEGRTCVAAEDIRQAALLALPHRMRRRPFEESRLDPEALDQAVREIEQQRNPPQGEAAGTPAEGARKQTFAVGRAPDLAMPEAAAMRTRRAPAGRRARSATPAARGRHTGALLPVGPFSGSDIALDATLRAAVAQQPPGAAVQARREHIRVKRRTRPAATTIVLLVDASGSMAASERMAAAKGAALSLLRDAYVKRHKVALVAFRGERADILLQPTDNVDLAHEQLKDLPTGGRTPLTHGLARALELCRRTRQRDADALFMTVVISDGKANVAYAPAGSPAVTPFDEAVAMARKLVRQGSDVVVLDTEDDFLSLGLARTLAESAGGRWVKLSKVASGDIEKAVRERLAPG